MTKSVIGFQSEAELVRCYSRLFQEAINDLNLEVSTQYEVPAPGGIPDMVIFNENEHILQYVITIEFKLSNWRRAIHQAFRYRNFGNEAFVILDQAKSQAAVRNLEVFKKANIGLITINANGIMQAWHSPKPALPFSKEFSQKVARSLLFPRQPVETDLSFIDSTEGGKSLFGLKVILDALLQKTYV